MKASHIDFRPFSLKPLAFGLILASSVFSAPLGAAEAPLRIVAIGGAITETLYALGRAQDIVGVDTTSLYPPEALRSKSNIGYFRAFSAEGVLSLKPSLVIAAANAGPADAIKQLQDAGVAFKRLPDDFTPQGVTGKIKTIGHLAHADAKAADLAKAVAKGFDELSAERAKETGHARVLFLIALQGGRPIVAGAGTAADAMIKLAGGVNAADGFPGYKQMSDESIIAAAPDVVVMMQTGKPIAESDVFTLPAFKSTPAALHHRLVAMDGLYLLGFGPRTPQAAKDLLAAFYPKPGAAAAAKP